MPIMSSGDITPGTGKVTFPDSSYASGASTSGSGSGSSTSSTGSGSGSGTFIVSGQNLGTPPGVGIFSNVVQNSSSSATLTFLSLVAGSGITLTATGETITIASNGGGSSGGGTIDGVVPVSEGGTGLTAIATNDILLGSGADVMNLITAPTSSNQFLYFDGNQIAWSPFVIQATNIQGLAAVATSGSYTDLANTPPEYVLPPASITSLGGVVVGFGLTVDDEGVLAADVISVNGQQGVVTLTADDIGAVSTNLVGSPNGVASLDINGKIPYSELPASLLGSLQYQGTWNANTNVPDILSGSASSANSGWFYIVDTPGLTVVDGNTNWGVGYWIISDGTEWNQIESSNDVTSVNGQIGAVEITATTLGLANVATSGSYTDLTNLPDTTMPIASKTTLGGIIVGNGLNVASNGVLSIGSEITEGIVQSVALELPSIFAVNGSPVTSTGTLTGVLLSQEANTFFAGPTHGNAAIPTFRALTGADLPPATPEEPGTITVGQGLTVVDGVVDANFLSWQGRIGAVVMEPSDLQVPYVQGVNNPLAGTFLLPSPVFTGNPTAPTPAQGDSSTSIATTAFVTTYVNDYNLPIASTSSLGGVIVGDGLEVSGSGLLSTDMLSFQGRIGAVTMQASDLQVPFVEGVVNPLAGTFLLPSPIITGNASFTGIPTSPTPPTNDNSTKVATTAFVANYIDAYNLPIATASTIGGVIIGDGLSVTNNGTISTDLISVAGRSGQVTLSIGDIAGGAPLASPAFSGTPTAPTPPAGDVSNHIATTSFVASYVDDYNLPIATVSSIGGVIIGDGLNVTESGSISTEFLSWQGRIGDVTILPSDLQVPFVEGVENPLAGTFILASPALSGVPTAPTPPAGDVSTKIATTAYVASYVNTFSMPPATTSAIGGIIVGQGLSITEGGTLSTDLLTVNGQTGAVEITYASINAAPLASPAFTGNPTAPEPAQGDNSASVATTSFVQQAMSSSVVVTLQGDVTLTAQQYSAPIIILSGGLQANTTVTFPSSGKWSVVNNTGGAFNLFLSCGTGQTMNVPQGAIAEVIAAGGIFPAGEVGITRAFGDNTAYYATTDFVQTALGGLDSGVTTFNGRAGAVQLQASDISSLNFASLTSPAFNGIPTAPTAASGNGTTQIATTAFVGNAINGLAPLASPAFTGTPTAPTPAVGDNSSNIATTQFIQDYFSTANFVDMTPPNGTPAGQQSTTMTLTTDQYSSEVIVFTGTPTVSIQVTLPSTGQWMIFNATAGTNLLTITNGQGTIYELPQYQSAIVLSLSTLGIINANIAGNFITPATVDTIGGVVIPNNSGLTIDAQGNLSIAAGTSGSLGGVSQGAGVTISNTGVLSANVTSVAGRTGDVVLTIADVSGAAPLASPVFTGTPTAPTPAAGDNSLNIATTQFVTANFASSLSPTFTGTPNAPTAAAGTKNTQIATTAFVANSYAPLASPALTGTPTAPTPAAGNSSTDIATTAFVATSFAPLVSPVFSGSPTAPTPSSNDDSQRIATTSWVTTAIQNADSASGYAPINAPTFTGRATFAAQEYDVTNLGNISGTETLNLASATEWTMTITGATTFAFSNVPAAGTTQVVIMRITNGGAYTINWPTGTQFVSGTAPTLTTSGVDILGVKYDTVTSTYMVFVIGLNMLV